MAMFAFVKFVDDGVTAIVNVEDIKKFSFDDDAETIPSKPFKVKFTDGHYYKAFVICVGESEQEVSSKALQKRIRLPNLRLLDDEQSFSESFSEGESGHSKECKSKVDSKKRNKNENSLAVENYMNIMKTNLKRLNPTDDSETNKLKLELQEFKKNEKKLKEEIENLRELNIKLQNIVIDKFKDLMLIRADDHRTEENEMKQVGARIDGKVHLGRNIWLPEQIFDSCLSKKKDSIFIKEIAYAVFGEHILTISSVTGTQCNRTKGPAKPALDPTKLMAIHDIVRYRLEKKGEKQEKIEAVCNTINTRIAEKIQDLTRPPKKAKKYQNTPTEAVRLNEAVDINVIETFEILDNNLQDGTEELPSE